MQPNLELQASLSSTDSNEITYSANGLSLREWSDNASPWTFPYLASSNGKLDGVVEAQVVKRLTMDLSCRIRATLSDLDVCIFSNRHANLQHKTNNHSIICSSWYQTPIHIRSLDDKICIVPCLLNLVRSLCQFNQPQNNIYCNKSCPKPKESHDWFMLFLRRHQHFCIPAEILILIRFYLDFNCSLKEP